MATISGMAKKVASVSAMNTDGESGKNKCSGSKGTERTEGGATKKELLCNRSRQREKLLCLQRIWAHSSILQEQKKNDENWGGEKTGIQKKTRENYETFR